MRKLIVKYLALSYRVRLFRKEFTFPRAANVIVPLMLCLGLALLTNPTYPVPNAWTWIALSINVFIWLIILAYFSLCPIKWHEADDEQKWFWGNGVASGMLKSVLSAKQFREWKVINSIERYDISKFHNVKAFLVIPVSLFLFLSIIILS